MPRAASLSLLLAGVALSLAARDAGAIPVFARTYNVPCVTCHTGDFKLNQFGAAFDQNGFQLPGTLDRTPIWNKNTPPISILLQDRVSSMHTSYTGQSVPDSSKQVYNSAVATIVGGGVIAPHASLMSEIDFENNGTELIASLEYAFVNFNNLLNSDLGNLDIRLGKMRMETIIEQTPEFYNAQYLIYNYPLLVSSRPQSFWLSYPMYSTMAYIGLPFIPTAPVLTAAFAAGDVGDVDLSAAHLFYARLSSDVEIGPVPVTIGLTGIIGHQTRDPLLGDSLVNDGSHFGVDWQISQPYGGPLSMYGHIMKFHSTDVLKLSGAQPEDATGGFIELNDVIVPEKITLQVRYDFLNSSRTLPQTRDVNVAQYMLMARYHLMPNMHVFVEGNLQNTETVLSGNSVTRSALTIGGGFFLGL